MGKKLSIKDIAALVKVSPTTISFILNGRAKEKRISDELAERVLKVVEEVGYKPNQLAKSLRTGKSKIIGLLVDDISNPFFANVARLIEEKASLSGYKIIYCSTDNNTQKTKELLQVFRDRQVDGYIINPPVGIAQDLKDLLQEGFPVVLFDRRLSDLQTNSVFTDNFESTYQAVKHLVERGYRRIAMVAFQANQVTIQDRIRGYRQAATETQLPVVVLEQPVTQSPEEVKEQLLAFFAQEAVDAVVFASNYYAIRGLEVFQSLKLRIPTDIAMVAFDDHDLFRLYTPPITVIAQPIEAIATHLISILLDELDNLSSPPSQKQLVLPSTLIVRESA